MKRNTTLISKFLQKFHENLLERSARPNNWVSAVYWTRVTCGGSGLSVHRGTGSQEECVVAEG